MSPIPAHSQLYEGKNERATCAPLGVCVRRACGIYLSHIASVVPFFTRIVCSYIIFVSVFRSVYASAKRVSYGVRLLLQQRGHTNTKFVHNGLDSAACCSRCRCCYLPRLDTQFNAFTDYYYFTCTRPIIETDLLLLLLLLL